MTDPRAALLKDKKDDPQASIFEHVEAPLSWEVEWQGMPEFIMGNTEPIQKITVSFASRADVEAFAALIGQKLSDRTDSIWFPKQDAYIAPSTLRYVDEP